MKRVIDFSCGVLSLLLMAVLLFVVFAVDQGPSPQQIEASRHGIDAP